MFSIILARRWVGLAAALVLAAALAIPAFSATPARAATPGPCDIYASGGTACEAAYSTTRALFEAYNGPLYQVQRASDSSYLNVGLESTGGVVNVAPENSFCASTTCTVTELYDQTANGNNMPISPGTSCSGCSGGNAGPGPGGADIGAPAEALPVDVGGQPAYGLEFDKFGTGYRDNSAKNLPTGANPDGLYAVMSSNITSNQCCFDFGQGETNDSDDGNATMNAIYYGTDCWTGNCTGPGPWVGADIENGMYFSNTGNNPPAYPSENGTFLSAWEENNGRTNMTLQYGNAQSGGLIQTYSGALPSGGYDPMKIQSSIELGTGGDNTSLGDGEFFEAADVSGFPSEATQSAVQANIVAAGYSQTPAGEAAFGGTAAEVPGTVQAANYDTGGQGVGYHVSSVNGTADGYRSDMVDLEATSDTTDATGAGAGYDLGWTGSGQWTRYTVNAAGAGTYTVSLRAASPNGVTDGLHIANLAGSNLSGNINVPATGGWQNWTTVTATVTLPAGTQTLVVDQDNGAWNLHAMSFAPSGVSSSWFEVVNQSSGLCATAAGGSTANGTAVVQQACTSAASQLWKFVPTSVSGYYDVVNDNAQSEDETWNITGGDGATAPGDTLQTWNYGGTGNTNALFSARLGSSGSYTFVADNSGLCLDAPSTSGAQLEQSTCNGTSAQAFSLVPNAGINTASWYEVVNEGSGLCATAAGGSTANGTAVEQLACTGATSQLWKFVATSVSGYYEVVNDNAQSEGESWNITGGVGATAPGDTLQIWNYGGTGNTNALFAGDLQYSGYYTFVAGNSGLCIDAPSSGSGVQLEQYTCNGTPSQAFSLLP